MLNNLNLTLGFDYLLCMNHNVVVDFEDKDKHRSENRNIKWSEDKVIPCEFVGQNFKIKAPARKLSNDVSKKLVDKIKEKENEKAWEKRHEKKLKQKKREQENYGRQIPVGDGILNLDGVELD